MNQKIHSSWLIALGCLGFVIGVVIAFWLVLPGYFFWIGLVVMSGGAWWGRIYTTPLLFLGGLLVGSFWGGVYKGELAAIEPLYGQHITLSGRIKEDPTIDPKRIITMQVDELVVANYVLSGTVWVSATSSGDIPLRGDKVSVQGIIEPGFGVFVGSMYRASVADITRSVPGDIGRVVRDWFASAVRLGIPEPQASLGIGFLTGQKSALPEELSEALRIAGLSHIVVASGYNLTILVRLCRRLFLKISRYSALVSSSLMVSAFMSITGLSPSMARAGLVSGLSLITWYYGRSFHPFVILPFAAAITVAWQPSYAWGDLGWLLSFSAFAGVMIVAPLFQAYFFGREPPGTMRQILGETVAAHIVTVPIIVMSFGTVSHVAIIANLLIVPLVPLAMLLTFIVGLIGLMIPAVVHLAALPITWLLGYMTHTATFLSELSWAQSEVQLPWWGVIVYYGMLMLLCWHMWRATRLELREVNIIE